jgi:uncharacterized protein (TIGR00369 family)
MNSDWQPRLTHEFSHFVGPVLERVEDGRRIFAFQADERHANDRGVVHGGMLMTFADQAFGELVLDSVGRRLCATVQLNTQFIAAVLVGDFVEGRAEVVRATRSLVFVRGMLTVGDRTVAAIDGIWKVLHNQQ